MTHSTITEPSNPSRPRIILIDDNIQGEAGHYLELSRLLIRGANTKGYDCVLATNRRFQPSDDLEQECLVRSIFEPHRMLRWSLGPDGNSQRCRDLDGELIDGSPLRRLSLKIKERLRKRKTQPKVMLQSWAKSCAYLIQDLKPGPEDRIVIATADDFSLLAFAAAMKQVTSRSLKVHLIFHFAPFGENEKKNSPRKEAMRHQFSIAISALSKHQIKMHATTDELKQQFNELLQRNLVSSICYPTRECSNAAGSTRSIPKAMLAGMARSEKGKHAIHDFLLGLHKQHLINSDNGFQPSLQVPARQWKSIIPKRLHSSCDGEGIELITNHLSAKAYHDWLKSANLAIFLYDRKKYQVRCSGVLLEMLCRGVPVIVPDQCWLASQVQLAGGNGSVGYIYQDRKQIPMLMQQFLAEQDRLKEQACEYAVDLRKKHNPSHTLSMMEIPNATT